MVRKLAVLLFAALPLFAQSEPERKTGVTFGIANSGGDLAFRRMLPPNWAILGSVGYNNGTVNQVTVVPGGTYDVTNYFLSAGVRRYLASSELRPFAEASAGYQWTEVPGCSDITAPRASAGGGVEYFVGRRVSIEGSAGLAYSKMSQRCTGFDGSQFRYENDNLGTFRTALSVTFYF